MGDRIDELSDARSAYDRRDWRGAFDLLTAAERRSPLAPEDVKLLAEAARWAREYGAMIDALEQAEARYERVGKRGLAAGVALSLCREHFVRNSLSEAGGWLVVPLACSRTSPNALPTATCNGPSAEPHGRTKIQCPLWTTPARRARSVVGWVTSM